MACAFQDTDISREGSELLVELGENQAVDGCSGAYEKFSGDLKKMQDLKDKADAEATKSKEAAAAAAAKQQACEGNSAEVMTKATWTKEIQEAKLKDSMQIATDKMKVDAEKAKKIEDDKTAATLATAKKIEEDAKSGLVQCKQNLEKTTKDVSASFDDKMKKAAEAAEIDNAKKIAAGIDANKLEQKVKMEKEFAVTLKSKLDEQDMKAKMALDKATSDAGASLTACQDEAKKAVDQQKKIVPLIAQEKIDKQTIELKARNDEIAALKEALSKAQADLVDTQTKLEGKLGTCEGSLKVCITDKANLQAKAATDSLTIKTGEIQATEQSNEISRLKTDNDLKQSSLDALKKKLDDAEGKNVKLGLEIKSANTELVSGKSQLMDMKSKMSAGEGAMMGEIERLKKELENAKTKHTELGNEMAKTTLQVTNLGEKYNDEKMRGTEMKENVASVTRSLDTCRSEKEHASIDLASLTNRFNDAKLSNELTLEKFKNLKIEEAGCRNALDRLKTYTTDDSQRNLVSETKLESELEAEKRKNNELTVSRDEQAKAAEVAKEVAKEAATAAAVSAVQAKQAAKPAA